MTGPRVQMVVHDAGRSGPPIFALELIGWLNRNTDIETKVLFTGGGPLEAEFSELCETSQLEDSIEHAARCLADADLVYINTAVSVRALSATGARPRVVLTHVHELDIGLREYLPAADHDLLMSITDHFLVGPTCARDNLVEHHGIAADGISQVPYFTPRDHNRSHSDSPPPRVQLDIPPDTVVIGACGTRDWRKGPDLFAHVAWTLERRGLPVPLRYVWVGSTIPSVSHWDAATDVALLGLHDRLHVLEHQPDPRRWLASFDVFALTSREDAFPLACLEAGAVGVPIVCFETGGIPELVRSSGGGAVVPYAAVDAMADEIEQYVLHPDRRRRAGDALQAHVEAHHHLDASGQLVADEIHRWAA